MEHAMVKQAKFTLSGLAFQVFHLAEAGGGGWARASASKSSETCIDLIRMLRIKSKKSPKVLSS